MTDLYSILNVSKECSGENIKKAYYQLALGCHPDRNKDSGSTRRFQELGEAYRVLSNNSLRRHYDLTGSIECEGSVHMDMDVDWKGYFRSIFRNVTVKTIERVREEYQGSEEEKADVFKMYRKYKGNMDRILDNVMFADAFCQKRFYELIDQGLADGQLEPFKKYTEESAAKKTRRLRRARRESAECELVAESVDDENRSAKNGRFHRRKGSRDSNTLVSRILEKQAKGDAFIESLARKYGCKTKQQTLPSDSEFEALQKRLFRE